MNNNKFISKENLEYIKILKRSEIKTNIINSIKSIVITGLITLGTYYSIKEAVGKTTLFNLGLEFIARLDVKILITTNIITLILYLREKKLNKKYIDKNN